MTIKAYLKALRLFDRYAADNGTPREVASIRREHVEAFIADILARSKPATAHNRSRSPQSFWKWCVTDAEIKDNPMRNMSPPKVPDNPPPVLSEDSLRRLLKACGARGATGRKY